MSEASTQTKFSSDDIYDSQKLFIKFNKKYSIKQRIEFEVERHDNNYYVDFPYDEFDSIPEPIRPTRKVTKDLLKKYLDRSKYYDNVKLSWVLDNMEKDFCKSFKENFQNNKFTSVKKAARTAALLYSEHCPKYQAGKATVISLNGVRAHKKRSTNNKCYCSQLSEMDLEKMPAINYYLTENYKQKLSNEHESKINKKLSAESINDPSINLRSKQRKTILSLLHESKNKF